MPREKTALEIFKSACRNEFQFLVDEFGFQESVEPKAQNHNPYMVRYLREDFEIIIEGISYGSAAMVILRDTKDRTLGVMNLDPKLDPFAKQSQKSKRKSTSQRDEIAESARLLREHGEDLLHGDFSVFEAALDRIEQAKSAYEARRMFGVAVQEAVAAFDQGEWQTVVDKLAPHEGALSKKMAKKLTVARSRL